MKTTAKYLFLAVLVLAGCGKETPVLPAGPDGGEVTIPAYIEDESPTRVEVNTSTGACRWRQNDLIAMWVTNNLSEGTVGAFNKYKVATVVDGSVRLTVSDGQERKGYAVYPNDIFDEAHPGVESGDDLHIIYPASYNCGKLTVSSGTAPLSSWSPAPMVSVNDEIHQEFNFFHVGGLLTLRLTDVPSGTKTIVVTFVGDESDPGNLLGDITGNFTVSNPGTRNASVSLSAGTGNAIAFNDLGKAYEPEMILNIPLPTQSYARLRAIRVSASGGVVDCTVSKSVDGLGDITRAKARKMTVDFNSITGARDTFRGYCIHPGFLKWDTSLNGGAGGYTVTNGTDPLELLDSYRNNASRGVLYHRWRDPGDLDTSTMKYRFDGNNNDGDIANPYVTVKGVTWRVPSTAALDDIATKNESDLSASITVNGTRSETDANNYAVVLVDLASATDVNGTDYSSKGLNTSAGGTGTGTRYIAGMLLIPDGASISCPSLRAMGAQRFETNVMPYSVLKFLTDGGCIFLPASGCYNGAWDTGGARGDFWSSDCQSGDYPHIFRFSTSSVYPSSSTQGTDVYLPVFLVRESE